MSRKSSNTLVFPHISSLYENSHVKEMLKQLEESKEYELRKKIDSKNNPYKLQINSDKYLYNLNSNSNVYNSYDYNNYNRPNKYYNNINCNQMFESGNYTNLANTNRNLLSGPIMNNNNITQFHSDSNSIKSNSKITEYTTADKSDNATINKPSFKFDEFLKKFSSSKIEEKQAQNSPVDQYKYEPLHSRINLKLEDNNEDVVEVSNEIKNILSENLCKIQTETEQKCDKFDEIENSDSFKIFNLYGD